MKSTCILATLGLFSLLAGCDVLSSPRYYTATEDSSELIKTTVFDAATGAPVIEIIESDEGPPSILVLPLPIGTPSVNPSFWGDTVRIERSESENIQIHAVSFESGGMTMPSGIANEDTDQDGLTDTRLVTLPLGDGFIIYHDFNADGALDAYARLDVEGESRTSRRAILFEDRWVAVKSDEAVFKQRPRVATSTEAPIAVYEFRQGEWTISTLETTPE